MRQLSVALEHGKKYNRAGAEWRVVRRKDLPEALLREKWAEKTVGLVVCIKEGCVVTVYYREDPSHHIRCKSKRGEERSRNFFTDEDECMAA